MTTTTVSPPATREAADEAGCMAGATDAIALAAGEPGTVICASLVCAILPTGAGMVDAALAAKKAAAEAKTRASRPEFVRGPGIAANICARRRTASSALTWARSALVAARSALRLPVRSSSLCNSRPTGSGRRRAVAGTLRATARAASRPTTQAAASRATRRRRAWAAARTIVSSAGSSRGRKASPTWRSSPTRRRSDASRAAHSVQVAR